MILQALNSYFDQLVSDGRLERPGWQPVRVSYALSLNDDGSIAAVLPLFTEETRGKKKVLAPQTMNMPAQEKRAVGIVSNFLCDNSSYILGADAKGKPERSKKCFEACRELHLSLLRDAESPMAQAIVRFFETWEPDSARTHPILEPYIDELLSGGNITFARNFVFAQNEPEIAGIWDRQFSSRGEGETMRCLVTGEATHAARLHPSIKGVAGGQSSGTSLVSFNAPAFESFGRDGGQGLNAPVSEKAAFAYSAALNYMIAQRVHHIRLSDTTVVFWAENGDDSYADCCAAALFGEDSGLSDGDLRDLMAHLSAGRKAAWNDVELDPDAHFFILGLAPNAARLSVRFFMQDTFGAFARNLLKHHEAMEIVRPGFDDRAVLSFWQILAETVNQKSKDKSPSPLLSGALVRAVLMGQPYPTLLLDQVELRVRAERAVNRGRAAIIKAFLLRNAPTMTDDRYKEALTVELNENTNYQPYLLGRLFAVLEQLQEESARPAKLNTTIRDRYFNSACATPAIVFPQLIKLAQAHLKKLEGGTAVYYNRQLGDLLSRFTEDFPARLSLYDQGIFQLGYYHQTQARYTKKEAQ